NDLSKSLLQAKTSHKYVLADVYTDWCGWCKRLDADTFGDQQMVDYLNQKFLVVKVNAEDEGGGKQVAEKYKVTGFPCALVFEPSGKFLGKISGYLRADQYQQALENLIKHPPADPYAD
ncbi:MAG TPA: thioredoxin family protein, partial [Candidatus Obscuribacterales bacterium]